MSRWVKLSRYHARLWLPFSLTTPCSGSGLAVKWNMKNLRTCYFHFFLLLDPILSVSFARRGVGSWEIINGLQNGATNRVVWKQRKFRLIGNSRWRLRLLIPPMWIGSRSVAITFKEGTLRYFNRSDAKGYVSEWCENLLHENPIKEKLFPWKIATSKEEEKTHKSSKWDNSSSFLRVGRRKTFRHIFRRLFVFCLRFFGSPGLAQEWKQSENLPGRELEMKTEVYVGYVKSR